MNDTDDPWLTTVEASRSLKLGVRHIRRICMPDARPMLAHERHGTAIRIRASAIEAWLDDLWEEPHPIP